MSSPEPGVQQSNSALHYAVDMSHSNLAHMFYYTEQSMLPSDVTPLMAAAARNDIPALETNLEEHKGKVTGNNVTALMFAAVMGSTRAAERLAAIEAGHADYCGRTALMLAAENRHTDIIHILIPYEVRRQTTNGTTALMIAVRRNHTDGVNTLLEYEAGMQDAMGFTALMLAAERDLFKLVRILLLREAQMTTNSGITALMMAATCNRRVSARILALKEAGMQCHLGWSALMMAANNGNVDIVELLMGEEGGLATKNGVTALMNAVVHKHVPIIRLLVDREARLTDINGRSATMIAAIKDYFEGVRELGRYEAGIRDKRGETAYTMARRHGHQQIAEYLEPLEGEHISKETEEALVQLSSSIRANSTPISTSKDLATTRTNSCEGFVYTPDATNYVPPSPARYTVATPPPAGKPKDAGVRSDDVSISDLFYSCNDIMPILYNVPRPERYSIDSVESNRSPVMSLRGSKGQTLSTSALNRQSVQTQEVPIAAATTDILPIHQHFRAGIKQHISTTTEITRLIGELKHAYPQATTLITALQRQIGIHLQFTSSLLDFTTDVIAFSEDPSATKIDLSGTLLEVTKNLNSSAGIRNEQSAETSLREKIPEVDTNSNGNSRKGSISIEGITRKIFGRFLRSRTTQE